MRIENSIFINADYDTVFDISNNLAKWPDLFDEYEDAEILQREGNKITFRLTNRDKRSWLSWRIIDKVNHKCYAERIEPKFPFNYMHLEWRYELRNNGVEMIWIQNFEMDEKASVNNEQAAQLMNEYSKKNMGRMKEFIENLCNQNGISKKDKVA